MYLILNDTDSIELEKFHQVSTATNGHVEDRTNFVFPETVKTTENVQMLKKYMKTPDNNFSLKVCENLASDTEPYMEFNFDGFESLEYIRYGKEVQFVASLVYLAG